MVKVFALIPKRPDVSDEFFHDHWAGEHAELAKRITTLLAYVQSHRIDPGVAGLGDSIYEGIAEVWFVDAETAAGMGEDPNYVNGCHVDEPKLMDMDNLGFILTDENVQREGDPIGQDDEGAKAMLLLRRAGGLEPAAFADAVRAVDLAGAVPDAQRVSVAVAIPEAYADGAEPIFDAVAELWFTDVKAFEAAWGDGEQALGALGDVIDRGASAGFLGDELRVLWPVSAAA
jgi:hypothetical protein